MTCKHCVSAVREALEAVDPQAHIDVQLARGRVEVDSRQPRAQLADAIREAGYTVEA
jgi:copper chaperone